METLHVKGRVGIETAAATRCLSTAQRMAKLALAMGLVAATLPVWGAHAAPPGTWTGTGSMSGGRAVHTATLLANGEVLVAGGFTGTVTGTAELYDPSAGTWSATGSMSAAREGHTATLLSGGKVLVAGGLTTGVGATATAELYDPSSGTWTAT